MDPDPVVKCIDNSYGEIKLSTANFCFLFFFFEIVYTRV